MSKSRLFCVRPKALVIAVCGLAFQAEALAISPSEFCAYETGSTLFWSTIPASVSPTITGGCAGGSDCLMSEIGADGTAPWQVVINEVQWTGNYQQAGVNTIQVWLRNAGPAKLHVRIGITNDPDGAGVANDGTCYFTKTPVVLAPGQTKQRRFTISDMTMSLALAGANCGVADSLEDVMSNVTQLRIFSASEPGWIPDGGDSTLLIDNIRATWDPVYGGDET